MNNSKEHVESIKGRIVKALADRLELWDRELRKGNVCSLVATKARIEIKRDAKGAGVERELEQYLRE